MLTKLQDGAVYADGEGRWYSFTEMGVLLHERNGHASGTVWLRKNVALELAHELIKRYG